MNSGLPTTLTCAQPVLQTGEQGIAFAALDETVPEIRLTFQRPLGPPPNALLSAKAYALLGGTRIHPQITGVQQVDPSSVALALDQIGDFSVYQLVVVGPQIDPFFATHEIRFRLECAAAYDCGPPVGTSAPAGTSSVAIDYLSKDYLGFRQALLDFVGARYPMWTERNEADLGMMLLELFSTTADTLSYQQDRVASEAFLETATQRRSVAHHLALLGYHLDEGAAASTFLSFEVNAVHQLADRELQARPAQDDPSDPIVIFETLGTARLDPAHNEFAIHTWNQSGCTLPAGTTSVALSGELDLTTGDFIAFVADSHADVVRLVVDPQIVAGGSADGSYTTEGPYTVVSWSPLSALSADYAVDSTRVYGNVVPATQGATTNTGDRFVVESTPAGTTNLRLSNAPLAFVDIATLQLASGITMPPAPGLLTRERRSLPRLWLTVGDGAQTWNERLSLLECQPNETAFAVEVADDGTATLVFGDGTFGQPLPSGVSLSLLYQVGGGSSGNIGPNTLTRINERAAGAPLPWFVSARHPVAASGGRDRESSTHAKQYGPTTFLKPLVAVTAQDYADAARVPVNALGLPLVQRANAAFDWTGSWLTVTLAVDPAGSDVFDTATRATLLGFLESRRLVGYDLEATGADYVPLELTVQLCVHPGADAADVGLRVTSALTTFFAPNQFTFGDSVYVSRLYAAASLPGVASVRITRLARYRSAFPDEQTAANLNAGALRVAPNQIVRLDNDRSFPEHGLLTVGVVGISAT